MDTRNIRANTFNLFYRIEKYCDDILDGKKEAAAKHLPKIKALIDSGVDLACTWDGLTPTLLAACYHLWDVVTLIAHSAKLPAKIKIDMYGYNMSLVGTARACNENHAYEAAVALINAGAKQIKYHQSQDSENEFRRDCVHWAIINKNIKFLDLLLKHAPNLYFKDSQNRVAIVMAAEKKCWPMVSLIARYHFTDAKDTYEYGLALCEAVYHGQAIVAQDLLKAGALQNKYLSLQGENNHCLHLAVMRNNPEMLQLLLSYKGNINRKNGQLMTTGITPIQMAFKLLHANCIKVLLPHYGNKIQFNQEEYHAYKKAVKKGKWDIAGMIICAASNINKAMTSDGNKVLHEIVASWSELGVWAEDILRYTIKKGAKQTIQNQYQQTPIELAGILKNWTAVKLFIEENQKDLKSDKIAKLHYEKVLQKAIQDENLPIVRLLLEYGSPCNESDLQKRNIALYSAVKIDNSEILSLLLKHGADVSQVNQDGVTIYDVARQEGGSSCIRVLDEQRTFALVRDAAKSSFAQMGLFSHAKSPANSPPKSPPNSPRKSRRESKAKQSNNVVIESRP